MPLVSLRRACSAQSQSDSTTHHSFRSSFSAVSTRILATKSSFLNIFQNLPDLHTFASLETQNFEGNFSRSIKIFKQFSNISNVKNLLQNHELHYELFQNSGIRTVHISQNVQYLQTCSKMNIHSQQSVLIQPRTSLGKSAVSCTFTSTSVPSN